MFTATILSVAGWWKKQIINLLKNFLVREEMRRLLIILFPNQKVISWNMQSSYHVNCVHLRCVKLSSSVLTNGQLNILCC